MEIRGTEGADVLNGGAGSDVIYGFGGNDTLRGGAGDDALSGNDGDDTLLGGDGDDYLLGGPGNDTLDGGAGSDWAAYDDATAGVKVDLNLTGPQNTVGGGTDKLISIENLSGSNFNDTLIGDARDNILIGGAGNDALTGGKGDDTLFGSAGNDTLDGGEGADWLVGGAGDDVIKGGAGADYASYEDATAGVKVDLSKTTIQDTVGAGKDTLTGVENLWGSAFDDTLTGDAGSNYLFGAAGNDTLSGGAGDDFFAGGPGINIIDGGDGADTVDYSMSAVGIDIDLSRNTAFSRTDASIQDTLSSIEVVTGSTHDDLIAGNAAENYLFGDAGNDVLWAVGGNDTLDGGDGDDILRGSFRKPGDMLLGGEGNDTVIVWTGPGSEGLTTVDGGAGVDLLSFASVYDITFDLKNTGDQLIAPGVHMVARNVENVTGGAGDDRLTGDAGANVLNGGEGNDVLDGGAGFDIASYEGGPGVRVDLSKAGAPQDTHGAGMDTLINIEGLRGSSLNDILIGDAKDNTLEGSSGNDILDGGAGVDTAIFWGEAKDYTWTLNTNGTWTVKGLDGADTLLNIETLKFNDKTVALSPSTTTVTVDDLLGTKSIIKAGSGDLQDAIVSADGRTVYVSDKDGYVSAFDTATAKTLGRWKLGATLGGMDLSADGRYLVAADRAVETTSSEPANYKATIQVHVLDLTTGTVRHYATTSTGFYDRGFKDAAFQGSDKIILTQDFAGTGSTQIWSLDLATGVFSNTGIGWSQSGVLSASDNGAVILVASVSSSNAPLDLLTMGKGVTATHGLDPEVSGFNSGIQAISGDGAFVAQGLYQSGLQVYNGDLKPLANLSSFHPEISGLFGMDFSADGNHLFVVDHASDKIFEYSTANWMLEKAISLNVDLHPGELWNSGSQFGDRVTLSDDSSRMILFNGEEVLSVDLVSIKPDGGSDAANVLIGSSQADKLFGYGGDDIITGGKGADTLIGGKGVDTFVFGAGDTTWSATSDAGVDVITDWEASDKLSFGSLGTGFQISRLPANSWQAALMDATQPIGAGTAAYLAYQVGADVYVFYKPNGTTSVIENVVKLANTTLDKIDVTTFVPNVALPLDGDDGANILTGGALDDFIDGKGGADIINGGKGNDVLTGGAGADVFKFMAGDGLFNPKLQNFDTITDFSSGDKLAFSNASAVVKETDIVRLSIGVNSDGTVPAASQLTVEAYSNQHQIGALGQKYLVIAAGGDTYIIADNDPAHPGYDQVVLLKNVSSSLVTADMFVAA